MGSKIIHLDEYFPTGEATIQPVMLWANGRPCYEGISKHASVGSDYFKSITPVPGHSFVYVLALGSWEFYGENRNGDSFPESPYMETANPPWIAQGDTLINHYKSFETAHNFMHHVNKDPRKAVGTVNKAFWNPTMHRVELLIDLDDAKAPNIAERIAAGEFPAVSMGTKVPYDVCSICGNRAPTRAQYCDHLKFNMKGVINGKKVSALNPRPRFFDISWVFRPADRTAFMLKKVAEAPYTLLSGAAAGEYIDAANSVKEAARKMAVIDKVVQGIPVDAKSEGVDQGELRSLCEMRPLALEAGKNTQDFPDSMLRSLSKHSLPSIVSSLMAGGMMQLSTPEMTKIIIIKSYPNKEVPDSIIDKAVSLQGGIFDLFKDMPQILPKLEETGLLDIGPHQVNEEIVEKVSGYVEKRAGVGQYLKRRFIPERYKEHEAPRTTPFTITDPATGGRYMTTRGAAIRAHDEIAKRNLYKMVGGGALLAGAYKLIASGLQHGGYGKYRPLAAMGLAALGATQIPGMGKHYMTDQGIPVPITTELAKVSSVLTTLALPIFGTLGTMAALSHDYQSRLDSGIPIGYEGLPLGRRILDKVEQFSSEHPVITGLGGVVLGRRIGKLPPFRALGGKAEQAVGFGKKKYEGAKKLLSEVGEGIKMSSYLEEFTVPSYSTVELPDVDIEKIAEWIGEIVVEG